MARPPGPEVFACLVAVRGPVHAAEGDSGDHFFFFNDTATTEIYTLSLHDALPISGRQCPALAARTRPVAGTRARWRSEEHTSELQSPCNLVCRLLLEKKKLRAHQPAGPELGHIIAPPPDLSRAILAHDQPRLFTHP